MADLIGGMNSLTNYLRSENEYQKKELEKEKQKISAQRIAQGFKSMTSNNTESDARTLIYDLINDAASLDSLDANLGLIDSLYRDTVNGIKQAKIDKEDLAIKSYVKDTKDFNIPEGISGKTSFDLYKQDKSEESPIDVTNKEGQVIHKVLNGKGQVISQIMKNERTDRSQKELDYEFTRKNTILSHSLSNQGLKGYAGLTDSGLPMLLGPNGLLVQQGGKLVMYDENIHGTVNKGNSYNTNQYKDFKGKVDYYQDISKSGYLASEEYAKSFAASLGWKGPESDPVTKKPKESWMSYLLRTGKGRQGLWNRIDAKLQNELGQTKGTAGHNSAYDQFQAMMSSYESNQNAFNEIKVAEVENKYNLGLDNFKKYDEELPLLFSIDTAGITSNISKEQAQSMGKVNEWVAFQLFTKLKNDFSKLQGKDYTGTLQDLKGMWDKYTLEKKAETMQFILQK